MGQSATLYQIDKNDFSKIVDNLNDFSLFDIAKKSATFEKTFEGLRFVLSKGRDKDEAELVEQIFYPKTFIGEKIDFANLDFKNLPDDFDIFKQPVYYNDPNKVSNISSFLDTVSVDDFKKLFDPDELNQMNIYPGEVWNRHTEENYAYNERDMTNEYKNLKAIFESARINCGYILSYLG